MAADNLRAAILISLFGAIGVAACVSSRDYDRALYGCVRCSLPEKRESGHALIYVVRPHGYVNQYDENNLYVTDGSGEKFFGAMISNTYCATNVMPGAIALRVTTTPKTQGLLTKDHGSEIAIDVVAGHEYFVHLDFQVGLVTTRSELKIVDEATGRRMLSGVQGKCHEKPYAERRSEAVKKEFLRGR